MNRWLDVVSVPWFERETENWKWWMDPGGRLEVYQPQPKHPMAQAIGLDAMCWHFPEPSDLSMALFHPEPRQR